MNIDSAFPSKWIKSADLGDRVANTTIAQVVLEQLPNEAKPKPVLYFQGQQKGMVLNKTNASILSAAYGAETDEWVGRRCQIYVAQKTFQGKIVPGLCVRIPARPIQQRVAPAVAPVPALTPISSPEAEPPPADADWGEPEADVPTGDEIPF